MVTRETDTEVRLRDAADQEISIPVKDIARRTNIGSLMPAGLIDGLLPEERLDLIAFLARLGKPGAFDAARGGVARAWKLYLIVSANQQFGSERVVAGDFTLGSWQPAYALASGTLARAVTESVIPNRNNNRGLFAATQFDSARGGDVRLALTGSVKGVWVNGRSIKVAPEFTVTAKPGANTVVVQLDDVQPDSIRLESGEVAFATQ
jgi:hypothetical protein